MHVLTEQIEDHSAGNAVFVGCAGIDHRFKEVGSVHEGTGKEFVDAPLPVAPGEGKIENSTAGRGFRGGQLLKTVPIELHIAGRGAGGSRDRRLEERLGDGGVVGVVHGDRGTGGINCETAGQGGGVDDTTVQAVIGLRGV